MTGEDQPTICPQCGNAVQSGDRFCGSCGAAVLPTPPQVEQVIRQPIAASHAPPHSRRPLLLAGVAGLVLLLIVGGGAVALLDSGGEEVELIPGVYAEVPEGWAAPANDPGLVANKFLVPAANKDTNDPSELMLNGTVMDYFKERPTTCDSPNEVRSKPFPEVTSGYDQFVTSLGPFAGGDVTVAGHPAKWVLNYGASASPWFPPDDSSLTASAYPDYQAGAYLEVCVEELGLHTTLTTGSTLAQDSEGGPTSDRSASVPQTREDIRQELRQKYGANIGAMLSLLESVDTSGWDGRTDLGGIPTSLQGIDENLSDPFHGKLEEIAGASQEPEQSSTSPTASPSSTASASPSSVSSEEAQLEQFAREYDGSARQEDWEATYSMLDESSQQKITEKQWVEKQQILADANGTPAPLDSVSVLPNEQMSDSPATITLNYEDGTQETMKAMIPMVVEAPSDSGVPKRYLTDEEVSNLKQSSSTPSGSTASSSPEATGSYGQSTEEMEAEAAAGEYYRAVGVGDWGYTYEDLDSTTRSRFTRDEWFQKNEYLAGDGSTIYYLDSVNRLSGSGEPTVEVTVILTFSDGSTSTRNTYFVYEDDSWKHRFSQEEYDLLMPDASYEEFVQAQQ